MPLPDPFAAFPRSHGERIEIAAQDLLLANATIATWCGSRIYRTADPLAEADGPWPKVLLTVAAEDSPQVLNQEGQIVGELAIWCAFEERRTKLAASERSVKSLENVLRTIFASTGPSRYLTVPRYNHPSTGAAQPLIEKVISFQRIDYNVITRGQLFPPDSYAEGQREDDIIARYATFGMTYKYHTNGTTWEKAGFTPPLVE